MRHLRESIGELLRRFSRDEGGVTAIEYGMLAALIAVLCVAGFSATGTSLDALYTYWSSKVMAALGAP